MKIKKIQRKTVDLRSSSTSPARNNCQSSLSTIGELWSGEFWRGSGSAFMDSSSAIEVFLSGTFDLVLRATLLDFWMSLECEEFNLLLFNNIII